MEFDLSISQINDLLAHVGKETKLAKRLSSHGLTNGRILVPDHIFDDDSLEQLWNIAKKTNDKSLYLGAEPSSAPGTASGSETAETAAQVWQEYTVQKGDRDRKSVV